MTPELLHVLLGSIAGGTGAMLSYWAGWRAREEAQRAIDTSARVRRADAELYAKFFDPSLL
jgi:membrane protein DedA with SNARE-associated domain